MPKTKANPALAKIHIAKKELGLDDDTYRDMLYGLTGKRSAADLTPAECVRVLKHMNASGAKVTPFIGKPPARKTGQRRKIADPQLRKIWAMWLDMHNKGIVRERGEQGLIAWIKQHQGIQCDALAWLNQEQKGAVINCLREWQKRNGIVR